VRLEDRPVDHRTGFTAKIRVLYVADDANDLSGQISLLGGSIFAACVACARSCSASSWRASSLIVWHLKIAATAD
jgi:hypothetical protein